MKGTVCALVVIACSVARAQEPRIGQESDLLNKIDSLDLTVAEGRSSLAPAAVESSKKGAAKADAQQKGPTEITSTKEATFDNKTRQAIFTGDVRVKDPEFTITCGKLTAFLHDTTAGKAASPAPNTTASPAASPARANGGGSKGGGLERAVAEGKVIIIQDKPGENGGPPKRYVGKAERAEYDAATGDVKLTGWPQIQQGINTQIATEASTVMIMNRDGRMKTQGGSKVVIQEQTE